MQSPCLITLMCMFFLTHRTVLLTGIFEHYYDVKKKQDTTYFPSELLFDRLEDQTSGIHSTLPPFRNLFMSGSLTSHSARVQLSSAGGRRCQHGGFGQAQYRMGWTHYLGANERSVSGENQPLHATAV